MKIGDVVGPSSVRLRSQETTDERPLSGWSRRWRAVIPCFYREDGAGGCGALPDLPGGAPRQDGDLDGDDTALHHLQLSRGGVRDVEDATFVRGFEGEPGR